MANDMGINPNSAVANTYAAKNRAAGAEATAQSGNGRSAQGSGNEYLGFQDFLNLIVAQMQNQDMMNPMKDTEFIGQMAQMATMQAVNNMTAVSTTHYASSLLGKEVTTAWIDAKEGYQTMTGVVTGVGFFEGQPTIYIGDKAFSLNNIMAVGTLPKKDEGEEGDKDDEKDPIVTPHTENQSDTEAGTVE